MLSTSTKATQHVIVLGHEYDPEEDDDLITSPSFFQQHPLPYGDVIRIKSFQDDPDKWYRNEGLFFVGRTSFLLPDCTIDDYGHVPEELYWPQFPIDYWEDVVEHNYIIPVRFEEQYNFTADDIKVYSSETHPEIQFPYIETPAFIILYPFIFKDNSDEVAAEIMSAHHVDVILEDMDVPEYGDIEEFYDAMPDSIYESFGTTKPIVVVIPDE